MWSYCTIQAFECQVICWRLCSDKRPLCIYCSGLESVYHLSIPFHSPARSTTQATCASTRLLQHRHQTGQAQRQITRTDLPALTRFGMLIKDMSIHRNKQNLSGTEFEPPMPRAATSDSIALAPWTISHLIGSFIEKKILIFGNKTFRSTIMHSNMLRGTQLNHSRGFAGLLVTMFSEQPTTIS